MHKNENKTEKELIELYAKKLTVKSKKSLIAGIVCASALIGGACATAGVFIAKAVNRQNEIIRENEQIVIDSSCSEGTKITEEFKSDANGNKVGTISSTTEKKILSVVVSKGDITLKENEDYIATPITNKHSNSNDEGSISWNVTILKEAFDKYGGKVRIVAKYEGGEPTPTIKHTVTLNNKETYAGKVYGAGEYNEGYLVTVSATANTGYKFDGWYEDAEYRHLVSEEPLYQFELTTDVTLHAKFETTIIGEVTITLDDQFPGESGPSTKTIKAEYGDFLPFPSIVHHDDYVLEGWYLDKECTEKYDFNNSFKVDTKLYGKWISAEECGTDGMLFIPDDDTNPTSYTVMIDYDNYENLPKNLVIPSHHEGKPVIGIEEWGDYSYGCFGYMDIETVSIPSTFNRICDYAFYDCEKLQFVSLPNTIIDIGYETFYECYRLSGINFEEGLRNIQEYAFAYSSLIDVTLPSTLANLDGGAFYGCYSLRKADLSKCNIIDRISEDLFCYCYSLNEVKLPLDGQITKINEDGFCYCYALSSIVIPSSVIIIDDYAFYECYALSKVTFAENSNLLKIYEEAFAYCYSLVNFEIPSKVTYIDEDVFYECDQLTNLNFANVNDTFYVSYYDSGYKYIDNYDPKNPTPYTPAKLAVDYGATFERNGIKDESTNLEFIIVSDEECIITGMTDYSEEEITIPLEMTYEDKSYKVVGINDNAFDACTNLTSVTFEIDSDSETNENFIDLGNYAFGYCYYIKSINNLDKCVNLNRIGSYAFYEVAYYIEDEIQFNFDLTKTKITEIDRGAFEYMDYLISIKLPETLEYVGNYAFYCCYDLEEADFTRCNRLKTLGYTSYEDGYGGAVFYECYRLSSIDLSNTKITVLPYCCFYECYYDDTVGLKEVKLPNTLLLIDESAFEDCELLNDIVIPESVVSIGSAAFEDCDSLKSVTIDSPLANIFIARTSQNYLLSNHPTVFLKEGTEVLEAFTTYYEKTTPSTKEGYDMWVYKEQ